MEYPKFEGLLSNGKDIDFLISDGHIDDAIRLLRKAERLLVLKRKRSVNKPGQFAKYNQVLTQIGTALRGNNSLLKRRAMQNARPRPKRPRRRRL